MTKSNWNCLSIRVPDDENIERIYRILKKELYIYSYWNSCIPPNIVELKVISPCVMSEKIKSEIQTIYSKEDECYFSVKSLDNKTLDDLKEFLIK